TDSFRSSSSLTIIVSFHPLSPSSMPNPKILVPARRRAPSHLEVVNARQRRPLLEHLDESGNRLFFALNLDLDTPVVQIPDAAEQVSPNGLLTGERPVGDSLHTPAHENSGSDKRLIARFGHGLTCMPPDSPRGDRSGED